MLVEFEEGIAWVTMNRPAKRNAISLDLAREMVAVILYLCGSGWESSVCIIPRRPAETRTILWKRVPSLLGGFRVFVAHAAGVARAGRGDFKGRTYG